MARLAQRCSAGLVDDCCVIMCSPSFGQFLVYGSKKEVVSPSLKHSYSVCVCNPHTERYVYCRTADLPVCFSNISFRLATSWTLTTQYSTFVACVLYAERAAVFVFLAESRRLLACPRGPFSCMWFADLVEITKGVEELRKVFENIEHSQEQERMRLTQRQTGAWILLTCGVQVLFCLPRTRTVEPCADCTRQKAIGPPSTRSGNVVMSLAKQTSQ